jgi:hypothetical protein
MIYIIIGVIVVLVILYQIGKSQQKSETNKSVSFNVQTNSSPKSKDDSKWEIVNRKTKRWTELGFGDGDDFPGYGRLYDREFKVWYCAVGSKEIKDARIISDRFPLNYEPKNCKEITGEGVYLDRLDNTKGYESLHTGLDNKNRKRWYFALIKFSPTWIETDRAIEKEETEVEKEEIEVPDGWELVRNHSPKWNELGYDNGFPGYGKVFNITFDVWYSNVGSKEKTEQPNIAVHLALYGKDLNIYYFDRVCNEIEKLKEKGLNFERLSRTQGYSQLYNGLDNSTKRRWYLGVKEMNPTNYYTANAE